jgi:hypothetical protein
MPSGKEIVTHDISNKCNNFVGLVDVPPGWHLSKPIVRAIPDKLWLVLPGLQFGRLAGIGFRAVAMRALLLPQRLSQGYYLACSSFVCAIALVARMDIALATTIA